MHLGERHMARRPDGFCPLPILYLVDDFGLKHLQVTCNLVVKYLQPSVSQAK